MIFCRGCGKEIHETAVTCPHCGAPQSNASPGFGKKQGTAFLLAFFLGGLGGHRFYLGNIGLGILYLFTFGLLGIGMLVDLFNLAFMRPEVFAAKYNNGAVDKQIGAWAKGMALIFPFIFVMGIIMGFYKGYKERHPSANVAAKQADDKFAEPVAATVAEPKPAPATTPSAENYQATPQATWKPSFDCTKASTFSEKAICSDPLLGKLDGALSENYKYMLASDIGDGARNDLKTTQKKWLTERNKCTNNQCLTDAYRKRLDEVCDYPVISGVHPICTYSNDIKSEGLTKIISVN